MANELEPSGGGDGVDEYIGYFKYSGRLVDSGFLDARKSAQALVGMDRALRHYLGSIAPELRDVEFELPVRVRRGSWEALLPATLGQWIAAGVGAALTSYAVTAAKKAAENDIGDKGLTDVIRLALRGIHWFIKVGKHLGDVERRKFKELQVDSEEMLIGIPNDDGTVLWLPKFHWEIFQRTPPLLLSEIASVIEEGRTLSVGIVEDEGIVEEAVGHELRGIFAGEEEEEEILFPELEHGMAVELDGKVTRGNGETNTIGFKYRDHILTCYPLTGSIVRYKTVLFSRATIVGTITRLEESGVPSASRPKIIFSDLTPLGQSGQGKLF